MNKITETEQIKGQGMENVTIITIMTEKQLLSSQKNDVLLP